MQTEPHKHRYDRPSRKARRDRGDGMQFLVWSCECGDSYASHLAPKEEIDEIAKNYASRVKVEMPKRVEVVTPQLERFRAYIAKRKGVSPTAEGKALAKDS